MTKGFFMAINTRDLNTRAETKSVSNAVMVKGTSKKVLETALGAAFGTLALVGAHHRYRKRHQPDARLLDYWDGIREKAPSSLPQLSLYSVSMTSMTRARYVYRQATRAYQDYPIQAIDTSTHTDLSALHTTVLHTRPVHWVSGVASMPTGQEGNTHSSFGVVGIDADRQVVWQTTMPERVHDIVVQPMIHKTHKQHCDTNTMGDVVVMGRRPSAHFWVLDGANGQVHHAIKAAADRHFYGHACYSLDGTQLYITENDTVSLTGKIGIYETSCYQKIAEFDSYGIGPHELIMHPDNETLIVANGGIKTEQASREELNLDTMRPSLVYLNRHSGELLEQVVPEHNQMSIRHLAMHDNGTVMIGVQFQGERHLNVPLVLTHQRGDDSFTALTMPSNRWQRFHQYIASVAVDSQHDLLCVTTPIGGCAAVFDLQTLELIDTVSLPDCAGAAVQYSTAESPTNDAAPPDLAHKNITGFIVSDGQGQLTTLMAPKHIGADNKASTSNPLIINSCSHPMSFDNHLQALAG